MGLLATLSLQRQDLIPYLPPECNFIQSIDNPCYVLDVYLPDHTSIASSLEELLPKEVDNLEIWIKKHQPNPDTPWG